MIIKAIVNGHTCSQARPPESSGCLYMAPSRTLPYLQNLSSKLSYLQLFFFTIYPIPCTHHPHKQFFHKLIPIWMHENLDNIFLLWHSHLSCPGPSQTILPFCKVLVRWAGGRTWLDFLWCLLSYIIYIIKVLVRSARGRTWLDFTQCFLSYILHVKLEESQLLMPLLLILYSLL